MDGSIYEENLKMTQLAPGKTDFVKEKLEQDTDIIYKSQKARKMAIKDELTEKFLSMFQRAREEILFLRGENEVLQSQHSALVEHNLNQSKLLESHRDCEAKVNSVIKVLSPVVARHKNT